MSYRDWSDDMKRALRDAAALATRTGTLTVAQIDSVLPSGALPDHVIQDLYRILEERGIRIVEGDEEPQPPA